MSSSNSHRYNKMCIGCQLANNTIPTYKVLETEHVNVILDLYPFSYGHILILPKEHYESVDDIPDAIHLDIIQTAKTLKPLLMKAFDASSVILLQNNGAMNSLKHYHLHLIPHSNEDLSTLYDTSIYQDNTPEKLEAALRKIKALL